MTWQDRAACLDVDPEAFFPLGKPGRNSRPADWTRARAACAACPVAAECLSDAIATRDAHGFRAGYTPEELARMLPRPVRQPVPIAHGTPNGARTHYRRGERPCGACSRAALVANRQRESRTR